MRISAQPIREVGEPVEMQRPRHCDPSQQRSAGPRPRIDQRTQPAGRRDDQADRETDDRVAPDRCREILCLDVDARHRQAGEEAERDYQPLHVAKPTICTVRVGPGHIRSDTSAA